MYKYNTYHSKDEGGKFYKARILKGSKFLTKLPVLLLLSLKFIFYK